MPKYLQTIFSTKPWLCISGLRFNLLFALFLLAAYNLPFARKLWSISPSVSFVAGGLFCAFTLLCAAVSLLFNRYTAKPLAIFFCILNALVFYFMSAYNTPIDKIMLLNVVQTDIYEVQDLLGLKLLTFLVLLGILPALIILKSGLITETSNGDCFPPLPSSPLRQPFALPSCSAITRQPNNSSATTATPNII